MYYKRSNWAKSIKFVYIGILVFGIFVVSNYSKKIAIINNNPIATYINEESNYKVISFLDTTSSIEAEYGQVSQEYTIKVKTERDSNDEYIEIANKLINKCKSVYGKDSLNNITINFINAKNNLIYNINY